MEKLSFTGERMLPEVIHTTIIIEHLHRYALASLFCKDKSVLDIASGEGYGSNLLSQYAVHVTGVDIDEPTVRHASKRYAKKNLTFKTGSADKIPLDNASVDVVVSYETIEHHDKHEEMMKEVKRVLKTDGLLIMSTPDKKYYTDEPMARRGETESTNTYHVKELYDYEFKDLLSRYFSNVKILGQQCGTMSAIFPLEKETVTDFWLSKGNTKAVEFNHQSLQPIFLIALASEQKINYSPVTLFNDERLTEAIYKSQVDPILNSRPYKIGSLVLSPFRLIRKIFSSKK